jgi:hypothetical protein
MKGYQARLGYSLRARASNSSDLSRPPAMHPRSIRRALRGPCFSLVETAVESRLNHDERRCISLDRRRISRWLRATRNGDSASRTLCKAALAEMPFTVHLREGRQAPRPMTDFDHHRGAPTERAMLPKGQCPLDSQRVFPDPTFQCSWRGISPPASRNRHWFQARANHALRHHTRCIRRPCCGRPMHHATDAHA